MINKWTMFIYNHSPVCAQNYLCTLAGKRYQKIRYGGEFDLWAKFFAGSRNWSEAELKEYQREQMSQIIRDCFNSIPYYAEKWRGMGLSADDFKDIDDLPKFPDTKKEDVFRNVNRMISTQVKRGQLVENVTGGSTGMPLPRYFLLSEIQKHYAIFWDRMRQSVSRGDRYAAFQGKEIVPQCQKGPPYWRENCSTNQRLYSIRHLSQEKLHFYAESLMTEPFVYYQGYASMLSVVAEYMADNGLKLPNPPKAVFPTSEQLTKANRRLFEETWQTKVWNEYCQVEKVAMIMECEEGNMHAQMDYGVIEYEPIGRENDLLLAEIICTGFVPRVSPLIRYRVGDQVLIDENAVCPCGRPGPVIKTVRGRSGDYILLPDGRKYPHVSLIVDLLRNVRRTQVVQERLEEITIRVVPFPEYSDADEKYLLRCFKDRLGGDIGLNVKHVQELERCPNGKVLSIINRVPGHGREDAVQED